MFSSLGRLLRKGHQASTAGNLEVAVDLFQRAVEAAPNDLRGCAQLALAEAAQGECEKACATADAMVGHFAENAVALLVAARCRFEAGEPEAAEPLLRSAASLQPENILVQQHLALCALMKGEIACTARLLRHVGRITNADFLDLFDREAEPERSSDELADELESIAARFKPGELAANAGFLALFSHEVERRLAPIPPVADEEATAPSDALLEETIRSERRAARHSPVSARGRFARGRIAQRLERIGERAYDCGEFADALAAFEAADAAADSRPFALFAAGLSALRLGRPDYSAERLGRAHARLPDDGLIASGYGDALFRSGRFAEALTVFEGIQPVGPEDFHAYYGRGACLTALGRKREALGQFQIAFEEYRLDAMDDCLAHSWKELLAREVTIAREQDSSET